MFKLVHIYWHNFFDSYMRSYAIRILLSSPTPLYIFLVRRPGPPDLPIYGSAVASSHTKHGTRVHLFPKSLKQELVLVVILKDDLEPLLLYMRIFSKGIADTNRTTRINRRVKN